MGQSVDEFENTSTESTDKPLTLKELSLAMSKMLPGQVKQFKVETIPTWQQSDMMGSIIVVKFGAAVEIQQIDETTISIHIGNVGQCGSIL